MSCCCGKISEIRNLRTADVEISVKSCRKLKKSLRNGTSCLMNIKTWRYLRVTSFQKDFEIIFKNFQNVNKNYLELLEGLEELQSKCMKDINHQRYRIVQITKNLK